MGKYWQAMVIGSALAVAVTGCGDDGSEPEASEDPVAALEAAATEWSESFYSGDSSDAYELFTAECKETFSAEEFKALSDFSQADGQSRRPADVTARVEGDRGFVDISYENPDDNDSNMPWILVDGEWKTSDCTMRE
ncbi:hypothetical protein [Rhodococcus aetherivorans]|uniref:hypothetical protein n=1 Tax=Rhodococcus aetherivorans TaxID=191292 RepID=UPI00388F7CD7